MIRIKNKIFKKPEDIGDVPIVHFNIVNNHFHFVIPDRMITNDQKQIYKVGFLFYTLRIIFPNKYKEELYELLNETFQIFLGKRQMVRRLREYEKNDFYK